MPAQAQQHPQVQADLNQAKGVVVQDAQKVIDNISKMPAQAQQHPQVQEKLAEAKKVVADHAPKPETQAGSPSAPQVPEGPSSTGADQPQGTSATINGTTPPAGHVTPIAMEGQINPNQTSPQSPIQLPTTESANASGQQPSTTVNKGKQPSTSPTLPPPSTPPQSVEKSQAIINNIMNRPPEARQHPQVQSDVAQAKQVVTDHVMKLENQPGPLSEGQKKALADAKTALSRLESENPTSSTHSSSGSLPPGSSATTDGTTQPSGTSPVEAAQTAGDNNATSPNTGQQSTTATTSPVQPSGPPLNVEKSQKLISNASKMPVHARQNPILQADLAQAQRVVAEDTVHRLEKSETKLNDPERQELAKARATLQDKQPLVEHSRGRTNSDGIKNDRPTSTALMEANQKLAADAPPRNSAPSTHVRMNFHDAHSETMRHAILLADHAHDAVDMKPVKITTTTTVGKDGRPTSGVYRPAHSPYDAEIGVSRDSDHPIMTALHEFGHHLRHHLDENDFKNVLEAAKQTPEVQLIKAMNYDPDYWLHENELFARAYAQWVIESVNHPEARTAKVELQNILGSAHSFEQFSGPAWQKVKARINLAMQPKKKP